MSSIQLDTDLDNLNLDADVDVEALLARIRDRVNVNQVNTIPSSLMPVPQSACEHNEALLSLQAQAEFNRAVVEALSQIGQLIAGMKSSLHIFAQVERDAADHRIETASELNLLTRGLEGIGTRLAEISAHASGLQEHLGRLELQSGQDRRNGKKEEELLQQMEFLFNYVATEEEELGQKMETRWRGKIEAIAARTAALESSNYFQFDELRKMLKRDLANAAEQFGFAARHNAQRMQMAIKKVELVAANLVALDGRSSLIANELADLRKELAKQMDDVKARSHEVEDTRRSTLQAVHGGTERTGIAPRGNGKYMDSFDYYEFAQSFRGTRADIRSRQLAYLPLFLEKENVIDLGCGRGEFVELLSERGVHVTGVERNQRMYDYCRGRNLHVVHEDLFDFLENLPDASIDGVFAAQVVEHLHPEETLRLIELWKRKLQPSGIVVAETINPHCPFALGNFCLDPTHIRPVPPRLLTFMFEQASLKLHSLKFSSPVPESNAAAYLDLAADYPEQVDLYQDYAAIGIRI